MSQKVSPKNKKKLTEKERIARRTRSLRRFKPQANRNRNTYFNKNSAQTIQRVWRGSKTRKSNNLHKMYSNKAKEYNNITRSRRENLIKYNKEKQLALEFQKKGYGYGPGQRNPKEMMKNVQNVEYADTLKINAGKSQKILNKQKYWLKKLATKQKYSRYQTPAERAAAKEAANQVLREMAQNNTNNDWREVGQYGPTYVKHSPGIYEEEDEIHNTYGWGGRRKIRRKHKRKTRKKGKGRRKKGGLHELVLLAGAAGMKVYNSLTKKKRRKKGNAKRK